MQHELIPGARLAVALVVCGFLAAWAGAAQEGEQGWPREFATDDGMSVVIFQPQLDDLAGNLLEGRAAV